ncbi:hypothetical protein ACG0Z6_08045 [Roseateles sp. BYS180W]|uniref:Chemotaxis protein n=1 Tax=Roseateles rivi TaxID=3299028 RepID=A0ABW7FV55_9BURK
MQMNESSPEAGDGILPLLAAAELQDHLMTVTNDLERLQRLLEDAGEALSMHFYGASGVIDGLHQQLDGVGRDSLQALTQHLAGAITALQFQDMSTQLITHTSQRLRSCADQLARDTFGDDEEGSTIVTHAPARPNPVTQDEMDAGSVELF